MVVRALLTHVPRSSFPPSTGSRWNLIIAIGLKKSVLLGIGWKEESFIIHVKFDTRPNFWGFSYYPGKVNLYAKDCFETLWAHFRACWHEVVPTAFRARCIQALGQINHEFCILPISIWASFVKSGLIPLCYRDAVSALSTTAFIGLHNGYQRAHRGNGGSVPIVWFKILSWRYQVPTMNESRSLVAE